MNLLNVIVVILVIMWLLGMFGHTFIGGIPAYNGNYLIHVLLVVAVIVLIFRIL